MKRRQLLTFFAAAAGAVAIGTGVASAQANQPIRIGMTVSSTGPFAPAAQSGFRGVELWVDDVNKRGGIEVGGVKRKVELIKLDDRSDKTLVPKVYESLINDSHVDFVFAPFGSTLTGAALNVTEAKKKFTVIWGASSDALYAQGYKYMISATQIAASLVGQTGMKALKAAGVKKIAFAYLDEPYPASQTEAASKFAKELGMEVTMFEKFPKDTKDFSTLLLKAKASGADVFYPSTYIGDQMTMARQMRETHTDFNAVMMLYASEPQFLQQAKKDSLYLLSQSIMHPKLNWKVTNGMNRAAMLKAYEAKFPNAQYPADFQTALAYGAGVIAEEIVKKAQSFDAEKLKQAALQLSGKIVTLTGEYQIDETGKQFKNEFVVLQNQPNGVEVVYPPEVATAKMIYPVPSIASRK
jgi:branched-chain amino acid transport system substrate-binding protein